MKHLLIKSGLMAMASLATLQGNSAPTKFAPNTYVSISKAGMNNGAKTDYHSTPTNVGASFTSPYNLNRAGLNAKDSFLYTATSVGADNTIGNIPQSGANLCGNLAKALVPPPVPLPVTLVSFGGTEKDGNIVLQWDTSLEKDFRNFIVEYSTDASYWTVLASVDAKSGTQETLAHNEYTYTHTNPNTKTGSSFYRLIQVDNDGSKKYGNVLHITR
ncbi:hypothetical protein DBR32_12155 [Taibaiella sp. KBW10]|uniref:hypothetical protein n=1 Tax=Taibaiella sp. KBW10 TaxID=2153357 RepID=UPI000F5AF0A3|nr:hypothetical protein [Taibaiella sp. KBW10]RQO30317.1 hypothetical protein DBR32_12155 [Taibaiella sp. KBW10]